MGGGGSGQRGFQLLGVTAPGLLYSGGLHRWGFHSPPRTCEPFVCSGDCPFPTRFSLHCLAVMPKAFGPAVSYLRSSSQLKEHFFSPFVAYFLQAPAPSLWGIHWDASSLWGLDVWSQKRFVVRLLLFELSPGSDCS